MNFELSEKRQVFIDYVRHFAHHKPYWLSMR